MAAAEVCWCGWQASQGGGGGLTRLGETGLGPPIPWLCHQGSGTRPLSGRSSMSDHSTEVAGWREPTTSELGNPDGVSGGHWTQHSSQ